MRNRISGFYRPDAPEDRGITVELGSVPITIEFERTPTRNRAVVSFTVNGWDYSHTIENEWKAIQLAKSKIAYGASIGLYSWDVATDVQELIDATMGDD